MNQDLTIILFEAEDAVNLYPVTLTRPAFSILCAGWTLYDSVRHFLPDARLAYRVRPYLQATALLHYGRRGEGAGNVLFLTSTLAPSAPVFKKLIPAIKRDKSFKIKSAGQIVGAYFSKEDLAALNLAKFEAFDILTILKSAKIKTVNLAWPRFFSLSDIIKLNLALIKDNLEARQPGLRHSCPGVWVGKDAQISEGAVFDTSEGDIIIEEKTKVLPFVYLAGPLYIGKYSRINEFASIKDGSSIGDVCKVGGEVEGSIIQGYSNKQHTGVLAHSYVGQWVNLGGGTSTSDLKNTYGKVKMRGLDTGQQFLGAIFADYSKTAINVGVYSGKVIGVNSFIYDTVAQDVPSFTNHLGRFGKNVAVDLEVAIRAQAAMFKRRQIRQTSAHRALLKDVFAATAVERRRDKIATGKPFFKR